MNRKFTAVTAFLLSAACAVPCLASPMRASADLGVAPGQVDNVTGIGIGDATAVLKHYAMEAAGLTGPLNDFIGKASADVNGDDYVNIADATEILSYYAKNAAGMSASFSCYKASETAFAAYKPIIKKFLSDCKASGLSPAYSYAYIDSNLIPELVLSPDTTHLAGGCTIYTYADGKTVMLGDSFGYCGEVNYSIGNGLILTDNGYTGNRWVYADYLSHGKITRKQEVLFDYNSGKYSINGTSVSESKAEAAADNLKMATFITGREYTTIS